MTTGCPHANQSCEGDLGTARKPVNNPVTFVWVTLLGLPSALFFILLFKLNS